MTKRKTFIGSLAVAFALVMVVGMAGTAFASETYWENNQPTAASEIDGYTTSYGVRAGSAGPDFMGISGTNFDFSGGSASQTDQYSGYTAADMTGHAGAGLAIWATSVNESPNPYYANLYYNTVFEPEDVASQATTWMRNEDNSSWGDSFGAISTDFITNAPTINGLEYEPSIIFGDAKFLGWSNFSTATSGSYIRDYISSNAIPGYEPVYVNNDATNIWTQVYSMGALGEAADKITSTETRYGSAVDSAVNYEKAIRGNMLYIASQIDDQTNNINKKTVAYLYAIDEGGTAYFFTPQADEMLVGDDTGTQGPVGDNLYGEHKETYEVTATYGYAGNNGTVDLGYMGVLPFITNTFDSGNPFSAVVTSTITEENEDGEEVSTTYSEVKDGIVMKVEDIFKVNPACTVDAGVDKALADVDVIIYNTTTATNLDGTSGGKNSSGVTSAEPLNNSNVSAWASQHGFTGTLVAGDDFGTSTNQDWNESGTTESGMAPLLYCQRNYTADKNARAAWAFSQVYPECYEGNANASYCYWVDNVYHVNTDRVPTVVQYMTNQSGMVTYDIRTATAMEGYFETGFDWWNQTGQYDSTWSKYSYYNGSSRASYYSGLDESAISYVTENDEGETEEVINATIGIFAPYDFGTTED